MHRAQRNADHGAQIVSTCSDRCPARSRIGWFAQKIRSWTSDLSRSSAKWFLSRAGARLVISSRLPEAQLPILLLDKNVAALARISRKRHVEQSPDPRRLPLWFQLARRFQEHALTSPSSCASSLRDRMPEIRLKNSRACSKCPLRRWKIT